MTLAITDFTAFHLAVHQMPPFPWQVRLLEEIVARREWPRTLDLPTGSGKTTCLDIALFALALDAAQPVAERWCPRRIAMVVDRRVVVDQVAERGRKLLRALMAEASGGVVAEVARRLRSLSHEAEAPIGVYTLRGGMPKDNGWARTPDQPLILASTVDQLGSRLLLQGYGVSQGMKPVHAGLVGNDILILLDEVHLSQPFAMTLDALAALRSKFARSSPLRPKCQHAFLSATPGASVEVPFRLRDDEREPGSVLGTRLGAQKPSTLVEAQGRPELEREVVVAATKLIVEHRVVGVIVNRVASAAIVAQQLRESLGDAVDVVLLTGRMRPLDRDDVLAAVRARIRTGRARKEVDRRLVVVGTQCIEAGADFDFDALVTECASLDALRQRFGRVDRIGAYAKSRGVIVCDRDPAAKDDPVYGSAAHATAKWLKGRMGKKKVVDFGVLGQPDPTPEEWPTLLAPKPEAPVLLPAYCDLWMQTSPPPAAIPDLALWLHGPSSGPEDVQVVWRVDLTPEHLTAGAHSERARRRCVSIVGAVPPSTLEAIGLPFVAARAWLSGSAGVNVADVEGVDLEQPKQGTAERLALRWDGTESQVVSASELRPGDTIVVPAGSGGLRDHCFDPAATAVVSDLAERANFMSRGRALLRLQPAVLAQIGLAVDLELDEAEQREALRSVSVEEAGWRPLWLGSLARGRRSFTADADPPHAVLEGAHVSTADVLRALTPEDSREEGAALGTDDDSFFTGTAVTLARHSRDVETLARQYGAAVGLPAAFVEDLALAGWLHDIGKADRRFQLMLRGGDMIDFLADDEPWAKSVTPPGALDAQRLAQERSGYPRGTRHEVQSVVMMEQRRAELASRAHDLDLVFHLVASHHGHCRPFAPVPAADVAPIGVRLDGHTSERFGTLGFDEVSSANGEHRTDSAMATRFWALAAKYGWHELCWLEAILRLADHRASELEQEGGAP
jgi:CRISPR-associated endonuclease/helicase Cas3